VIPQLKLKQPSKLGNHGSTLSINVSDNVSDGGPLSARSSGYGSIASKLRKEKELKLA